MFAVNITRFIAEECKVNKLADYLFVSSTTWAKTCREARTVYADKHGLCLGNVLTRFVKD